MKLETLRKHKNLLVTLLQTVVIVALALIITIVSCGFDFKEFNWKTFIFNFLFTTIMKMVYTSYGKFREMQESETVILTNTIASDRSAIYNAQKTKEFDEKIAKRNKISKLEAYINKLDAKEPSEKKLKTIREKRMWAFNYKQALIKNEDTEKFEEIRSIKSIKVDYEHIESAKLFTYGANASLRKKKYVFSTWSSSLNRAIIPTTVSIIFSVIFGAMQNNSEVRTGQVWIDLAGYLFSIGIGIWWGWNNGKAIIKEDYNEVLNNVASLIREIKTELKI